MQNSKSNSNNTKKSQSETVAQENSQASYLLSPSLGDLKKGESRNSYLERQGLSAILEYEKKQKKENSTSQEKNAPPQELKKLQENLNHLNKPSTFNRIFWETAENDRKKKEIKWERQEEDTVTAELKRLQQEADYHANLVTTYLTDTDSLSSNTSGETVIRAEQVEQSLKWLETIEPDVGQQFRQELLLKHKDRFDREMKSENLKSENFVEKRSEKRELQQQCMVSEQPSSIRTSNGLGISQYLLSGLLFLYVVDKIYGFVYKSKNIKKD